MAARVTASVVDFAALASKIPAQQSNAFVALKGKVEGHLRNVNTLPAALPAIDFSAYSKVTVPGMVDNFQKKYEALTIPYPSDQGSLKGKIVSDAFSFIILYLILQLLTTKLLSRKLHLLLFVPSPTQELVS